MIFNLNFNLMIEHVLNRYNYYILFFVMFISLFSTITKKVLLHKLVGLSIFQTTIIWLYLTIGFNYKAIPPVIDFHNKLNANIIYNNPLTHALMLTAIVVGIATFAVGLAIIIKIDKLDPSREHNEKDEYDNF